MTGKRGGALEYYYPAEGFFWADGPACCKEGEAGEMGGLTFELSEAGYQCAVCGDLHKNTTDYGPPQTGRVAIRPVIGDDIASNPFLNPHAGQAAAVDMGDLQLTDLGNAELMTQSFGHRFCHVHEWGDMIFDGFRWTPDKVGAMLRLARATLDVMVQNLAEKSLTATTEEVAKLRKHTIGTASESKMRAMISLARSHAKIAKVVDQFDTNKDAINTISGVINLATGECTPPDPDDMMTHLVPYEYDPDAKCPRWMEFLRTMTRDDGELMEWLQRSVGYTLTGRVDEQRMWFLYGDGANGKTTFLEVIRTILNDYACALGFDALLKQRNKNTAQEMAKLPGKRFATAVEAGEGRAFDEETIKQMTGKDKVSARNLYKDSFEFIPEAKPWIAANDKPAIAGATEGIWRRFFFVPCQADLPTAKRDGRMYEKLMDEAAGIFAWMVRGAVKYLDGGLGATPRIVADAATEYKSDNDVVARFISERCTLVDDHKETASELLKEFNAWAQDQRERQMTAQALGRRLRQYRAGRLHGSKNGQGAMEWTGLKIMPYNYNGETSQAKGITEALDQHDRVTVIMDIIRRLAKENGSSATLPDILVAADEAGISVVDTNNTIATLVRNNSVYAKDGTGTLAPL